MPALRSSLDNLSNKNLLVSSSLEQDRPPPSLSTHPLSSTKTNYNNILTTLKCIFSNIQVGYTPNSTVNIANGNSI